MPFQKRKATQAAANARRRDDLEQLAIERLLAAGTARGVALAKEIAKGRDRRNKGD